MNNERRKALTALADKLENEIAGLLDELRSELETLRDEEQDYYDNMPESFQNSDRGERASAAVDALTNAIDDMENFDVSNIVGQINEACE